jgi:Flp pilus assembly protein CpaB
VPVVQIRPHQGRPAADSWLAWSSRLALRRRLLVAVLTGVAVLAGLAAVRPGPAAGRAVWVATRDLSGGEPLQGSDVRLERLPLALVPSDSLTVRSPPTGRLLAAPVRRGEPLTDVRVLGAPLLTALDPPADRAVPVHVADAAAALAVVHAGDLIDIIAAPDSDDGEPEAPATVVHDVRVLATPGYRAPDGLPASGEAGGLLVVAASLHQATALAQAAASAQLSVAVRRSS